MLTATEAAILNNKIAVHLAKTGKGNGMSMPASKNNTEGVAWDYLIAGKIEAYGKAAKDRARKAAISAGVMFDHEENPLPAGSGKQVYNGDVITILCTVKNGSFSVDSDKLARLLRTKGVSTDIITQCFGEATKQSRAPHTFVAALVVDE